MIVNFYSYTRSTMSVFGKDNKKFNVIYADPPFKYDHCTTMGKADNHYSTMEIDDISKLPVSKELASDDCIMLMWCSGPTMKKAIKLMEDWGFKYKTVAFVWRKLTKKAKKGITNGLGRHTRPSTEFVLLGTKGKVTKFRKSAKVQQYIEAERREHSRKPDEVRKAIDELYPDVPRIELFARETTNGWDSWGNETNKFNTTPMEE